MDIVAKDVSNLWVKKKDASNLKNNIVTITCYGSVFQKSIFVYFCVLRYISR